MPGAALPARARRRRGDAGGARARLTRCLDDPGQSSAAFPIARRMPGQLPPARDFRHRVARRQRKHALRGTLSRCAHLRLRVPPRAAARLPRCAGAFPRHRAGAARGIAGDRPDPVLSHRPRALEGRLARRQRAAHLEVPPPRAQAPHPGAGRIVVSDAARAARAAETRILLCHRLNLGDLVLASPALQWFARRNPGVHFGLYTNDFAARVGELLPGIERVIRYRKFDAYGLPEWRALLEARRWRPESVIGLTPAADWRLALRVRLLGGRVAAGGPGGAPRHVAERLAWLLGWRGEEVLPPVRLAMPRGNGAGRDVAIWVSARKPSNRPRAAQVLEIVRALRARRPGVTIGVFALPG